MQWWLAAFDRTPFVYFDKSDGVGGSTQTDAANQDDTKTQGNEAGGVTFTDEQQEHINRLVADRLERKQKAWDRKVEDRIAREKQAAVDEYKSETEAAADNKSNAAESEVRTLKGKLTKSGRDNETLAAENVRLRDIVQKASVTDVVLKAATGKLISPKNALVFLGDRFKLDPKTFEAYIVDKDGNPSGETVDELIDGLINSEPHLAPPRGSTGSGSHVAKPGNNAQSGEEDRTTQEWRRKKLGELRQH
jgi:hypothetical protein